MFKKEEDDTNEPKHEKRTTVDSHYLDFVYLK